MAMQVGELFATISLDDAEFVRRVDRAGLQFSQFGEKVRAGTRVAATAFAGVTTAAAGLGLAAFKVGKEYNVLQQTSRAALKTIMGSGKAAADQMDRLDEFARSSPFGKNIFIKGQQQLLAFGMEAKKVIPTMDAVQQAIAAAGGSSQDLQEVIFVLAQIKAAGKITGQDLMQLGQRGIDAAGLIGQSLGKSGQEIRESITSGTLSVDQALDALTQGMATKFKGATDAVKEQWVGAADRIKAAFREIGSLMARPFINPNGGGWAVTWGNQVADVLQAVRKKLEPLIDIAQHKAGPAFQVITDALTRARQAVERFNINKITTGLADIAQYGPLIAATGTALFALGSGSIPILGRFVGAVNPAVAGLAALVATHPGLRETAAVLARGFGEAAPAIGQVARAVADLAMGLLDALTPGLHAIAAVLPEVVGQMARGLAPALSALASAAVPVASVIGSLAEVVAAIPAPILTAVAAFVALNKAFTLLAATNVGQALARQFSNGAQWLGTIHSTRDAVDLMRIGMSSAGGAVRGLGAALKTAFISNPIGLGIAAITTALGAFMAAKQAAAERVREFTDALKASNGVLDENVRKLAANQLEEAGALEAYKRIGGDMRDLVDASLGAEDALARVNAVIDASKVEKFYREGSQWVLTEDAQKARDALTETSEAAGKAQGSYERLQEAQAGAAGATQEHTKSLRELNDELMQSANAAMQAEKAASNWYAGMDEHAAKLREVQELERQHGSAVNATADAFNAETEAGRHAIDQMQKRIEQGAKVLETMQAQGDGTDALRAKRAELVAQLTKEAHQFGLNEAAAQAYVEKLLGIPADITSKATLDIQEALAKGEELQIEINDMDGTIKINGNPVPAQTTLGELIGNVDQQTGTVKILGDDYPADQTLADFLNTVRNSKEATKVDANTAAGMEKIWTLRSTAGAPISVRVTPNTAGFRAAITAAVGGPIGVMVSALLARAQKDGGVINYFANGSERHVAQIAPAGAWRVWAEPETGGEAYIPLSAAKRARSTAILNDVADRFGYMLLRKGATGFADGGTHTAPHHSGAPAASVNVTNVFNNPLPVPISEAKSRADRELALAVTL